MFCFSSIKLYVDLFLSLISGVNLDDLDSETVRPTIKKKNLTDDEQYQEDLRFNNAMRETFLNRFVHMFSAYEHFVILPDQVLLYLTYLKFVFKVLKIYHLFQYINVFTMLA